MIEFGTGGFRGVIGDNFNKENICKVAQGLADMCIQNNETDKPIVIGFDNRFLSNETAYWLSAVLNGNNLKTIVITSPVPTPVVMSFTQDMDNYYGLMVTASHNPYIYNGIKLFIRGGYDADVETTSKLEKIINKDTEVKYLENDKARLLDLLSETNDISSYFNKVKSFLNVKRRLSSKTKILYNNLNGVGYIGFNGVKKQFNVKKFDIYNTEHDAFFSFGLPNPTKEMLIGDFSHKVVNDGYSFGIATDSDGDRLGVIDELGNYVSANEILACLYYYLVTYRHLEGDIVKNLSTSVFIDKVAEYLGYKCHEVDVGFKNITSKMKETDALIGGESSGGLTIRNYIKGKDATFSGSLFIEMVLNLNKPVSEIIRSIKDKVGYHALTFGRDIHLKSNPKECFKYIYEHQPELGREIIDTQVINNNIKYYFSKEDWLLLRLSGTEPTFRVTAEGSNCDDFPVLFDAITSYIKSVDEKLRK